jgi:uncharacterized membrane protein
MADAMEEALKNIAGYVSLGLQAVAILVIVIGAIEAVIAICRLMLERNATNAEKRVVWLEFARWLVAGLTFQLAADIVQTTVAPSWDEVGRLAAIAAIRTFLTFFVDRDIDALREAHSDPVRKK